MYTLFIGSHLYRFTFEHVLPELDARLAQLSGRDETDETDEAQVWNEEAL